MQVRTVASLWDRFHRSKSEPARTELIKHYAFLVTETVDRLRFKPWGQVERGDLISQGAVGLISAIDRYNPDLGFPFEPFARLRIKGAIFDYIRRLDWTPRSQRSWQDRRAEAQMELERTLHRQPSDAELAAYLHMSEQDYLRAHGRSGRGALQSLDDPAVSERWTEAGGEPAQENATDPQHRLEREQAILALEQAIGALEPRDRTILHLYYIEEQTLKQIGKHLGITEQRVSQLHARLLQRLRHHLIPNADALLPLAA